ncbi:MAG: DUF433 domain-containing protein [Pseudonocardiales bacterium]
MMSSIIESDVYRMPLYTPPQAARIVAVPPATLRNWVQGYSYKTLSGVIEAFPMITTARVSSSRAPSLPFLGLAEAYVLAAFRAAGVPMQRIRPAIHWLDQNIGLPAALASERLMTDGAEILYDFSRRSPSNNPGAASAVEDLVVVRNQQRVFVPVVSAYLQTVSYREGYVEQIRLPQYQMIDVIVDPRINSGTPTVADRGIRVADIVSRLAAGEPAADVARDYRLDPRNVASLATWVE